MRTIIRRALSSALNRPAPPPLPRDQQREFEQLQRAAQLPSSRAEADAELTLHPDARKPIKPDFEGDINPLTGEQGGPKTEPVAKWVGKTTAIGASRVVSPTFSPGTCSHKSSVHSRPRDADDGSL
ncbi:hypothetical protein JVT61DRAFT_2960 [Boletus reticuloceps]|uniref:Succinate dehydrogenase assembly factor 4, mitochondrial n=1 Tax=Boletus reticuloceps TaxID=495285 RepID=A0A8I2YQX2_9AGAM|nr:hypothetical protein JVT61DRAFT_2960 [Boletus reticuloceps]